MGRFLNILDASYEGIAFPVASEESDVITHGLVEHVAYRRDGADLEHTGRDAQKGTLAVPLINDVEAGLWPDRYDALIAKIRAVPKGELVLPVEGRVRVGIKLVKRTTDPDVRNGVHLSIEWIEDNADASTLTIRATGAVATNTPASVTQQAAAADAAMVAAAGVAAATRAPVPTFTPTGPVVAAQLAILESNTVRYAQVGASIATMVGVVSANLALPFFGTVAGYPAATALEALRASLYGLRTRYLPDQDRTQRLTTAVSMTAIQLALQWYGDASLAYLIGQANALPDPAFIPAGTSLVLLPAP